MHIKFMRDKALTRFQLLQEFVSKSLWKPALKSCEDSIEQCKKDLDNLTKLKLKLIKEVKDDE